MTLAEDTLRLTLWYGNYSTQSIPSFLSYVYWLNFWMQWGLPVEEGQVEGSKIRIKVFIDELVVNAKVVCVCRTFGLDRSLEGDKIKPLLDIFTCTHQHVCSLVHGGCFKGWFCLCDVRLYLSQIFTSHYLSLCVHSVLFSPEIWSRVKKHQQFCDSAQQDMVLLKDPKSQTELIWSPADWCLPGKCVDFKFKLSTFPVDVTQVANPFSHLCLDICHRSWSVRSPRGSRAAG